MADKRKPGKARAWSVATAVRQIVYRSGGECYECGAPEALRPILQRAVSRAYLAGIKAAQDEVQKYSGLGALVHRLVAREQARLGLAPTGTGKGGKRKSGEGQK